jgi:hypothetical protein
VPTTGAMKDIIVKIMVEVLGIFAIVTKEIKQGRASESFPNDAFSVANGDSETYLKKYFKKLIGMKDIEDALSRLDILTQEEVKMATAQILKLAHHIKGGVEAVSEEVKDVGDKINRAIEGMSSTFATQKCHRKPTYEQTEKR